MRQTVAIAAALTFILSIASAPGAPALTGSGLPAAETGAAQKAGLVCSYSGCVPEAQVQERRAYLYPPACPNGYYFACRHDPFGRKQCACWPYRPHY